jgi:hypothetical protein
MQKILRIAFVFFFAALGLESQAQNPGGTACLSPVVTSVVPDSNKINLTWMYNSIATIPVTFTVEYTTAPLTSSSTMTSAIVTGNSYSITGLTKCKEYYVRIKTNCSATSSSTWTILTSKTKGCTVATPCVTPVISTVTSDTTKATVSWNATGPQGMNYVLEYTTSPVTNTSTWTAINTMATTTTVTGLSTCKGYIFRVKAVCSPTTSSAWSALRDTKTKGCVVNTPCNAPTLNAVVTDSTKATVSWSSAGVANSAYILEYTTAPVTSSSIWSSVTSSTNSTTITGLSTCTVYIFRVKAVCSPTTSSAWSATRDAKTKGCVVVTPCNAPVISTVVMDTTKATVSWAAAASGTTYVLEYTTSPVTNTSVWTAVNSSTNTVTITGLTSCTGYIFRVKAICSATASSTWSALRDGKTKGCIVVTPCNAPILNAVVTDSTKATVSWGSSGTPNSSYIVEYTVAPVTNSSVWSSVTSSANSTTITGLSTCTVYIFRVKAICSPTTSSTWSTTRDAKTKGCVVVTPCNAPVISTVVMDTTKATVSWAAAASGTTYVLEYTTTPVTNTSVWTAVNSATNTVTVTGLTSCTGYIFRVKAICSATASSTWSALRDGKTKGCVVVTPCVTPTITNTTADSTKATISWINPGVVAAPSYTIEYTAAPVSSTSVWTSATSTTSTFTATGLANCKEYIFRVKANCSATSSSGWSNTKGVKTLGCSTTTICKTPNKLTNTATANSATLSWVGSGVYFQVRIKNLNNWNGAWTVIDSITANTLTRNGLATCNRYIWQVRAKCSNGSWTSWSDIKAFGTTGCTKPTSLVVSPNPGANFNLYYNLPAEGKVTLDLVDIQGRTVKNFDAGLQYSGDNQFVADELDIQSGVYFIILKVDGIQQEVQRWIKN